MWSLGGPSAWGGAVVTSHSSCLFGFRYVSRRRIQLAHPPKERTCDQSKLLPAHGVSTADDLQAQLSHADVALAELLAFMDLRESRTPTTTECAWSSDGNTGRCARAHLCLFRRGRNNCFVSMFRCALRAMRTCFAECGAPALRMDTRMIIRMGLRAPPSRVARSQELASLYMRCAIGMPDSCRTDRRNNVSAEALAIEYDLDSAGESATEDCVLLQLRNYS